jgi:hypothetical protein
MVEGDLALFLTRQVPSGGLKPKRRGELLGARGSSRHPRRVLDYHDVCLIIQRPELCVGSPTLLIQRRAFRLGLDLRHRNRNDPIAECVQELWVSPCQRRRNTDSAQKNV